MLKLFSRHPRGVTLTDEGRKVFENCRRIFKECASIERIMANKLGPIRLAASENLCIHLLPKIFADIKGAKGISTVELLSGGAEEVIQAVLNDESDVGYCYHPSKIPGLSCRSIASVEFWAVVNAKVFGKNLVAKDLKRLSFVGSFTKHYHGPNAAKSLLAEAGLIVEAELQCNSQEAQVSMVENGLGFSLVPWFLVHDKIRRGTLARVPLKKSLKTPLFRICRLDESAPASEQFDEALKTALER
jgi:DNA-binding transcriptional LysR family regulator